MRLPDSAHESGSWLIGEIVPDFTLEDVWALPASGGAADFEALVGLMTSGAPSFDDSPASRFLWRLRDRLGAWFDLGRISVPAPEGGEGTPSSDHPGASLANRLPEHLRGTAAGVRFDSLPFVPLYRTDSEFAAEISNRTVHGVMHLAWAEQGEGLYQGQMAVYVKPRGRLGKGYMELIKPFRHWIVYPALTRQVEREWLARPAARGSTG